MKTIQITKREQLVLMTVVRVAIRALQPLRMQEVPPIERGKTLSAMQDQPGFVADSAGGQRIPEVNELESILERLGDEGGDMTLRAKELRIVFEDDDRRTYTQTFAPPNAAVLNAVAAAMKMGSEEPPIVGPVLRKKTEVRGQADRNGIDIIRLPHLLPEEIRAQDFGAADDLRGPLCDFCVEVSAVPVKAVL